MLLNRRMLRQLSVDEASNHRAKDLLGDGGICFKLDGKSTNLCDDLLNALRRFHVGRRFLECGRLLHIRTAFRQ